MKQTFILKSMNWHFCNENDWKDCSNGVNCYSYILNNPKYYWAVPGLGFFHETSKKYIDFFNKYFEKMSFKEFKDFITIGAVNDGLIKVKSPEEREGYYLAALFFPKNKKDFHWYRKDNNTWSHKDGWKSVRNEDQYGKAIINPILDAKKIYEIFGGYFLVPVKGITLSKRFLSV